MIDDSFESFSTQDTDRDVIHWTLAACKPIFALSSEIVHVLASYCLLINSESGLQCYFYGLSYLCLQSILILLLLVLFRLFYFFSVTFSYDLDSFLDFSLSEVTQVSLCLQDKPTLLTYIYV